MGGPIVGWFDDYSKSRHSIQIMAGGLLAMGFGYVQLAPTTMATQVLALEKSEFNLWMSMVLTGFGGACALIPTYNSMYRWARHGNKTDEGNATSVVYNLVYAFGGGLGPTAAGWL